MRNLRRLTLTLIPLLAVPVLAMAAGQASKFPFQSHAAHDGHPAWKRGSPLVDKVRRATERYRDINVMLAEKKWVQATPCVSGPNAGAMGVHFVHSERIGDGTLDPELPEALIYEPLAGGAFRLVGVEFIEIAEVWDTQNEGPPSLDGHLLNLVTSPNRYGLPAFYELHVWGWERNPNGSFADWNTLVSCDKQAGD